MKSTLLVAALLMLALAPTALAAPPKASTSIVGGETALAFRVVR